MSLRINQIVAVGIISLVGACSQKSSEPKTPGIVLEKHPLSVRFVDNTPRFMHISDSYESGMNGIASLIHDDQHKNIFSTVGMNLEETHTNPPAGNLKDVWDAPRQAPMDLAWIDSSSVRMTQKATEASGLNIEILFTLRDSYLDQTITVWPDHDVDAYSCFWASYMNQVQNTSLFIRERKTEGKNQRWLELASAGHSAADGIGVYGREYDPYGLSWDGHLIDNPLLRQAIKETPFTRNATLGSKFNPYPSKTFDHFYYGFVDEYVYLMIFREPEFTMWMSASGGMVIRSPAWDYEINGGSLKANEKKEYHVRLVYKKFKGIEDIFEEVDKFLNNQER